MLQEIGQPHGYWLSRGQAHSVVWDEQQCKWDIRAFGQAQPGSIVDHAVQLGYRRCLPAWRLGVGRPQEGAEQRRRRLRQRAKEEGETVSEYQLRLAEWLILVTNVPPDKLSVAQALVLARVRWQVELLFKLWKSHGRLDDWPSAKPWPILGEVYAKLLAMLVQHWLLLVPCWAYPDRSLPQTIRKHAFALAPVFSQADRFDAAMVSIQRCLRVGCRTNKRKARPAAFQLLLDPALLGLA